MTMLALALSALFQAVPSAAAPARPTVSHFVWLRRPTGADIAQYYPKHAAEAGVSGRGVLNCRVQADGTLAECMVEDVSPPDEGFGEALLRLSPLFQIDTKRRDGKPLVDGPVRIPVEFRLADGSQDQVSQVLTCYGRKAAQTELDPNNPDKQLATRFWALQVMMAAGDARLPPSSVERQMAQARIRATALLNDAAYRGVDADCDRTLKAALKAGG